MKKTKVQNQNIAETQSLNLQIIKMLLIFMGLALGVCVQAYAAVLVIKNDDSVAVEVIIEPSGGRLLKSTPQIKQTLPAGEERKIEVRKEEMDNASTFSVTGKVRMPSLYNKCGPLFIDRDYRIVFVGSKAGGTICIQESESLK